MGNTNLSSQSASQLINKCWQPISSQLWRNKITSEIIKEKRLMFRTQQEMKYVFACLVRRMNDYHPNVMKVFYLRKLYQKASVCNCGQKHTIQVYVENVENTLQKYITKNFNRKNQALNRVHNSNKKCVCMQIVKAAAYLKERYGPFIVSNKNVWIQEQRVQHQTDDRKGELSKQQKGQSLQTIKAKLWISAAEEQNFPDRSCEEREMCFSIVSLIKNCLVDSGLCKCFHNLEVLDRLMHVGSVKDLEEIIRKEREEGQKKQLNVIKEEPKVHFTRTRAYSSQDSTHNQNHFAPNLPHAKFKPHDLQSQRKYSLVEQVRKPATSRRIQFVTPPINQILPSVKQIKTSDNAKNVRNKVDNYFIQESGLAVKLQQKTRITKMYSDQNSEKQSNLNVQHLKNTQSINPRTHYNRHLNVFLTNKPIISLADMTGDDISAVSTQTIKAGRSEVQKTKQSEFKDQELKQDMNDRENDEELSFSQDKNQIEKVQKIELKMNGEGSPQKMIEPTDRTRLDNNSLKGDDKKQPQQVSSSRNPTSTIPISLNSSSLAGQFPKLIIHQYSHKRKASVENNDFVQQIIEKKDQQYQKKGSASSSKSEKNYVSHHGGSEKSMEEQKSTTLNKRLSGSNVLPKKESEGDISKDSNEFKDIHIKQTIRSRQNQEQQHTNNLDILDQFLPRQQHHTQTQTQLSSLGLLQFQHKFKTNESIEENHHHQYRNELRKKFRVDNAQKLSILQCVNTNNNNYSYKNYHQQQQLNNSSIKQSSLHSIRIQKQSFVKGKMPYFITQGKKKSGDELDKGQLIKRQSEYPASPYEKFRLWQQNEKEVSYEGEKESSSYNIETHRQQLEDYYGQSQYSYQQQHCQQPPSPAPVPQTLSQNTLPQFSHIAHKPGKKKLSLKQQFSQLFNFDNQQQQQQQQQTQTERKQRTKKAHHHQRQVSVTVSMYNSSEYKESKSNGIRKRGGGKVGYHELRFPRVMAAAGNQSKQRFSRITRKSIIKEQVQEQTVKKSNEQAISINNDYVLETPPQQHHLRMTSSGHEDNSIRQKVISKKAQFAQLKNQMNSLLL